MPAYCYEENLANIKHAKQQKKKKSETKKLIIHSHYIVIVNVISLALA